MDFNVILFVTDSGGKTISEIGVDVTAKYNGVTEIEMCIQTNVEPISNCARKQAPIQGAENNAFYWSNLTCLIWQLTRILRWSLIRTNSYYN